MNPNIGTCNPAASGLYLSSIISIPLTDPSYFLITPFFTSVSKCSCTVAKLDTRTGDHYPGSPYPVCDNPSRTAVDPFGNCWVACRHDGRVMKLDADDGHVLVDVAPGGSMMRALAIDPEGFVWVGAWYQHRMYQLDPFNGQTRRTVSNVTCPYGAAADRNGRIWVIGAFCDAAATNGVITLLDGHGAVLNTWWPVRAACTAVWAVS